MKCKNPFKGHASFLSGCHLSVFYFLLAFLFAKFLHNFLCRASRLPFSFICALRHLHNLQYKGKSKCSARFLVASLLLLKLYFYSLFLCSLEFSKVKRRDSVKLPHKIKFNKPPYVREEDGKYSERPLRLNTRIFNEQSYLFS